MTKNDLAEEVGPRHDMNARQMSVIIDDLKETIIKALSNGNSVYMRGFGTFTLKVRKKKVGQNISKGICVEIPEQTIPHFKPCKAFKEKVLAAPEFKV